MQPVCSKYIGSIILNSDVNAIQPLPVQYYVLGITATDTGTTHISATLRNTTAFDKNNQSYEEINVAGVGFCMCTRSYGGGIEH
jgi:hypothetical protein